MEALFTILNFLSNVMEFSLRFLTANNCFARFFFSLGFFTLAVYSTSLCPSLFLVVDMLLLYCVVINFFQVMHYLVGDAAFRFLISCIRGFFSFLGDAFVVIVTLGFWGGVIYGVLYLLKR